MSPEFAINVDELDIYPHNRLAIIGPNGAGKTTLLQLISHLLRAQKGIISFDGAEIRTEKQILDYHRATAFVPQKSILYNCSVKENVAIGLKIRQVSPSEIESRVVEILESLKIAHLSNKSALKISGGEARRTMLARALVLRPKILWLDEPFGDLDEPIRRDLIEDLLPLLSRTGCATVFVTHNQDETYQLADRFLIMLKGAIVQQGNAREVFANPISQEVAEFIGVKNVIPARVIGFDKNIISLSLMNSGNSGDTIFNSQKVVNTNRELRVVSPEFRLLVSGGKPKTPNLIVCIPSESIIIATDLPDRQAGQTQEMHSSSRNIIPGRIHRIIPARYFAWVEIDCGVILTASITNESIRELGLVPGKPVRLLIKSTAIRVLEGMN